MSIYDIGILFHVSSACICSLEPEMPYTYRYVHVFRGGGGVMDKTGSGLQLAQVMSVKPLLLEPLW